MQSFQGAVEGKEGLEIGGPSGAFQDSGILPIYRLVKSLDNCVFSKNTTWEGERPEGRTFRYHSSKAYGFNFIREACSLHSILEHSYDFVLSSHNLEHVADPVRALKEWIRVMRPGGVIIIILPNCRNTFDHRRKPTTIAHMLEDYERGVGEADMTHLAEILELHDLSCDPAAGTFAQFHDRSLHNSENRCLHHHVFDENNSRALLEAVGLSVHTVELVKPHHIVLLGQS